MPLPLRRSAVSIIPRSWTCRGDDRKVAYRVPRSLQSLVDVDVTLPNGVTLRAKRYLFSERNRYVAFRDDGLPVYIYRLVGNELHVLPNLTREYRLTLHFLPKL